MDITKLTNSQIEDLIHKKFKDPKHRTILHEHFIEGKTYDEIVEKQLGDREVSENQRQRLRHSFIEIGFSFKQYVEKCKEGEDE